jgi:hypothetical protein
MPSTDDLTMIHINRALKQTDPGFAIYHMMTSSLSDQDHEPSSENLSKSLEVSKGEIPSVLLSDLNASSGSLLPSHVGNYQSLAASSPQSQPKSNALDDVLILCERLMNETRS